MTEETAAVRYTVLSTKAIWWTSALVVIVGIGMAVWLLLAFGHGDDKDRNRLEAIKTAGTIVVGTGGAVALLLAARRQRSTEIALKQKERDQAHQERVAAATEADALERRVTELYTKAADQLGSEKAPVRLAGLYALERLAQANPDQRQTVVNVLCAYLRMPYQLPDQAATDETSPAGEEYDTETPDAAAERERRTQEREVRLAAQRILIAHLRPGADPHRPVASFWQDIDLDLSGALLIDFNMAGCHMRTIQFRRARFTGDAELSDASVNGDAEFGEASFGGDAEFARTRFAGLAVFVGASFAGEAAFGEASFAGYAGFQTVSFGGDADFGEASFSGAATFSETSFNGDASFSGVSVGMYAGFVEATFAGNAHFDEASFAGAAGFRRASFGGDAAFGGASFAGDARFDRASFAAGLEFTRVDSKGELIETRFAQNTSGSHALPAGWQLVPEAEGDWCVVRWDSVTDHAAGRSTADDAGNGKEDGAH